MAFDPEFGASAATAGADTLALQSNFQLDNTEDQAASSIVFPAYHAWPEASDLLEILMNVDAGWPMDARVPLTDSNPGTFCESDQVQPGEGSFARARQAMRHMSNLMQDLVRQSEAVRKVADITLQVLQSCDRGRGSGCIFALS